MSEYVMSITYHKRMRRYCVGDDSPVARWADSIKDAKVYGRVKGHIALYDAKIRFARTDYELELIEVGGPKYARLLMEELK